MGELSTLRLHQPAGAAADPVTVRDLKALQDNVRAAVDPLVKVLQAAGVSQADYLALTGGTMAGNIAMGGNKVTGLAAASSNGDALRYEQLLGIVSAVELGYLAGVTSGIQAQLAALQAFYGFSAYLSADQLNITAIDKIDWDSVFFDTTGGDYASGTFTPSIAGYYTFNTGVRWVAGTVPAGDSVYFYFYKAGAIYRQMLYGFSTSRYTMQISGEVYANGTTDTFDVYAQNANRNTSDIDASISVAGDACWFDMHLIKAT